MMRLPHAALALLFSACGGPPASAPAPSTPTQNEASNAATEANPCPFGPEDLQEAPFRRIAGVRMGVRLPQGSVQLVGMPTFAHECGLSVTFGEVSPRLGSAESDAFFGGMVNGLLDAPSPEAAGCALVAEDTWNCPGRNAVVRFVNDGEVRGLVSVGGPRPIAEAIAATVRSSADAEWDPVKAMRLGLTPVEGMQLDPLSSPPLITYALPVEERPDSPRLEWRFVPYLTHPDHADSSPWTDRELGRQLGEQVVTRMEADPASIGGMETRVLRETDLGQDLQMTGTATVQGQPIRFYGAFLRENIGFFMLVGRAPEADAPMWLDRFERHIGTFRVLSY